MTLARPRERLGRALRRLAGRRIAAAILRPVYATPPYRMMLGRRAAAPERVPTEPWPGDSALGAQIVSGRFALHGEIQTADIAAPPWHDPNRSEGWRAALNGFEWLRDLRAVGGDAGRAAARAAIADWIEKERRVAGIGWREDVLANRVASWLVHAEFVAAGADEAFRQRFHASLAAQARHLSRVARYAPDGSSRFVVGKALVYAAFAWPAARRRVTRHIEALEREIVIQVLADGGHVERNPERHLAVLRHLIDIRANLREANAEIPAALQSAIDRMAPMLRFFRHGDGGLALFNGGGEARDWLIDMVLTHADARGKPLASAPHTGFERMAAHRTLVIMDAGAPPPPGFDAEAHAGTLSFEMSVGKERLIVNCGAYVGPDVRWREASRTTAAHSTLVVEDVNSSELLPDGLGLRPRRVTVERREDDGAIWVDAQHDGYLGMFGLVHKRRLYLSAAGDDFRGEETLAGPGNRKLAVRFHLHPQVKASMTGRGSAVLLRMASGAGWQLRANGGVTNVQESVYFGAGGEVRRTEQIVISAATKDTAEIRWAISRVTG